MSRFFKQRWGPLVLLVVAGLVAAACGGSSSSSAPGATTAPGTAEATQAESSGGNGGGGDVLSGAVGQFGNLQSYKFTMTWAGSYWSSYASLLGGTGETGEVAISGTIIAKPEKAADVSIGDFHIIEVGGKSYMDMGSGQFVASPASGASMADSFAPGNYFTSALSGLSSDYKLVGEETKNGVTALHFSADPEAVAQYGTVFDVTDATWAADTWVAKDGGYPVSMSLIATASDGSSAFKFVFDVTNINDPGNKVEAPTNVMSLP